MASATSTAKAEVQDGDMTMFGEVKWFRLVTTTVFKFGKNCKKPGP